MSAGAGPSNSGASFRSLQTPAARVVLAFIAAVESRDPDAVGACFADEATYCNVPHAPAIGPAGISDLFRPILRRAERVVWDLVSGSADDERVWLERVDRFWIGGREYHIECNGVYEVDPAAGLIVAVRDYVDLDLWRRRLGDVLT